MRDYITLGPTPLEEPYAQVGEPDFHTTAPAECKRFLQLLYTTFGPEPAGARLAIKWFPHDLGSYCEVVCYYDTESPAAVDYAFRCEAETPATWKEEHALSTQN